MMQSTIWPHQKHTLINTSTSYALCVRECACVCVRARVCVCVWVCVCVCVMQVWRKGLLINKNEELWLSNVDIQARTACCRKSDVWQTSWHAIWLSLQPFRVRARQVSTWPRTGHSVNRRLRKPIICRNNSSVRSGFLFHMSNHTEPLWGQSY